MTVGLVVGSTVSFLGSCGWCGFSGAAAHPVIASTRCCIVEGNFLSSHDGMQPLGKGLLRKRGHGPIAHQRHAQISRAPGQSGTQATFTTWLDGWRVSPNYVGSGITVGFSVL
jgi:hypothetical protein